MKKTSAIIITVFIFIGLFFAFKTTSKQEWVLDKAHGKLSFTVGHLMVSEVEGWFKDFDATITSDKEDFSDAVVTMTAQTSSINTENEMRDKDLKSDKYFNVIKYPALIFRSRSFIKVDGENYKVTGDMTIHGITKTVGLNARCRMGINPMTKKPVAGFKVTGTISRLDFGIGASAPVAMIGEVVSIVANVEFGNVPLP